MTSPSLAPAIDLAYDERGSRDHRTVLFVHGAGANHHQFERQLRTFGDRYHVVAPSLRGHDGSGSPAAAGPGDFTREILTGDVVALLDRLGVDRVHLVGNSLGGIVGLEMLQRAPGRLASLTTFGTAGALHAPSALVGLLRGLLRITGSRGLAWITRRAATREPRAAEVIGDMFRSADSRALRHIVTEIADYDYIPALRRCTVPVMVIRGSEDRSINRTLKSTIEALGDHGRVAELPGAGHFANLDRPEEFDAILTSFLEGSMPPRRDG